MSVIKEKILEVLVVASKEVTINWAFSEEEITQPKVEHVDIEKYANGIQILLPKATTLASRGKQNVEVMVDFTGLINKYPHLQTPDHEASKLYHLIRLSYLFLRLSDLPRELRDASIKLLESLIKHHEHYPIKIGDYEITYVIPTEKCTRDEFFECFVGIREIKETPVVDDKPTDVEPDPISDVPDIDLTKIPNSDNEILNVMMKDGKYVLEFRKEFLSRPDLVNFTSKLLNL